VARSGHGWNDEDHRHRDQRRRSLARCARCVGKPARGVAPGAPASDERTLREIAAPEAPHWTADGSRYLARLALEAGEAEDRAVQARQELAAASARLTRARARVVGS